jgi:hypothetical protein
MNQGNKTNEQVNSDRTQLFKFLHNLRDTAASTMTTTTSPKSERLKEERSKRSTDDADEDVDDDRSDSMRNVHIETHRKVKIVEPTKVMKTLLI